MTESHDVSDRAKHEAKLVRDVNVILPVGGLATRALEVTEDRIPKHLIRLKSGQTVLGRILRGLQREGYKNFVFCTGHHSEAMSSYITAGGWRLSEDVGAAISHENRPLGPDGAVIKAIDELSLDGEALILPGDVSLPWNKLAAMSLYRRITESDVTLAVTSEVTPRTTDVGKLVVDKNTSRLEHCYGRNESAPRLRTSQKALTSAAALAIDIEGYMNMCEAYSLENPGVGLLSMRDGIAPWASHDSRYKITAYDIQGEILDLGTPGNIMFGRENLGE